jgi:hypothetical protein
MGSFDFGGIAALANEEGRVAQAGPNAYAQQQQLGIERQQAAQEKQLNDQKIQQQQIQLDDQKASSAAMHEWDGKDMNALPGLMIKHGASANAVFSMKNGVLDYASKQSTKAKTDLENDKALHDEVAGALSPGTDPKQVSDADLPNWIRSTGKSLLDGGKIDPQHEATVEQLAQLPPEQARQQLEVARKGFMAQSQINDELAKKAEAGMNDAKSKLDAAQAEAANYKEDPNLGLIDLRTKQPVSPNALAPLGPGEAEVLGKKPGDMVPLKLKNTANEIVNRGIHVTSANGRQIMVDGQGNTIKDLGTAPAVVNFNMQGGNQQYSPDDPDVQKVAKGAMKIGDVMTPRTPLPARRAFLAAVLQANPDFDSRSYDVEKGVMREFTSGDAAKNLTAFNTAIEHATQLQGAADALGNGDTRALNKIGNSLGYQFGSDKTTNFNVIKNALSGEISKVFKGGQATDAEIREVQQPFDAANSPEQLKGAIKNAISLMNSKRDALKQQYQQGSQGKPNFGGESGSGFSVKAPNGKTYSFKDQQSLDAFKQKAGIQ